MHQISGRLPALGSARKPSGSSSRLQRPSGPSRQRAVPEVRQLGHRTVLVQCLLVAWRPAVGAGLGWAILAALLADDNSGLSGSYCSTISARRFCGSRTPSAVGTSRPFLPAPIVVISPPGTPSVTRPSLTAAARRSLRPWL